MAGIPPARESPCLLALPRPRTLGGVALLRCLWPLSLPCRPCGAGPVCPACDGACGGEGQAIWGGVCPLSSHLVFVVTGWLTLCANYAWFNQEAVER